MIESSPNQNQMSFLAPDLIDQLNPKHPLLQLAKRIPWLFFESEFTPLYSTHGRPAKRIQLMVGLCILKHMKNVSDDVIVQDWAESPYYQSFCGEKEFQWKLPCDPTDLIYFRKRIGEQGFEKILPHRLLFMVKTPLKKKSALIQRFKKKTSPSLRMRSFIVR